MKEELFLDVLKDISDADLYHFVEDSVGRDQIKKALLNFQPPLENFLQFTPSAAELIRQDLKNRKKSDINDFIIDKKALEFTKKIAEGLSFLFPFF